MWRTWMALVYAWHRGDQKPANRDSLSVRNRSHQQILACGQAIVAVTETIELSEVEIAHFRRILLENQ